ncbi:SIR2 family protein [Zunongwangia sp. HGR-M22]|uniref:SIR2 family protein n=1 Tax=Zunongwangia sp. HGR-M22 TaxID=3015168 RepID=UPI0022DD4621|nr:SIR2 family protein [Zunongwangia sp. HGR-M22]WBL26784.1 SIR2 family protein [Zunongwangia sp. HGR-M22]
MTVDENWRGKHILKLRDYKEPTVIEDPDSDELRNVVEPWLTALFQSEHLSLLTGAGISSAVHYMATGTAGAGMGNMKLSAFADEIKHISEESAKKSGRGEANIEDEIRTLNELIRGLEIISSLDLVGDSEETNKLKALKVDLEDGITNFANTVLESERNVVTSDKDEPAEYLMNFILSFASRIATRERLNLFTTNYDRITEFGAELAGLHLIDRFVGSISPIFRSSRLNIDIHYNPPGIRGEPRYLEGVVNFTKLHGSLDWIEKNNLVRRFALPYGAESIKDYSQEGSLMIYPNSSKDRETSEYPYVELFRDLASSIIRPNSTVVTYGYSFGDDHINRVLIDMLTIPSTHLVIIGFDDIGDRIKKFYSKAKRPVQITLLLGYHFGDLKTLVDNYLPKPAIDRTTYKMADLLKARGTVAPIVNQNKEDEDE